IEREPASSAFSSSSLSAAAGRSTTSPAAIWLTRTSGRVRITPTGNATLPGEVFLRQGAPERQERHDPREGRRARANGTRRGRFSARRAGPPPIPLLARR